MGFRVIVVVKYWDEGMPRSFLEYSIVLSVLLLKPLCETTYPMLTLPDARQLQIKFSQPASELHPSAPHVIRNGVLRQSNHEASAVTIRPGSSW